MASAVHFTLDAGGISAIDSAVQRDCGSQCDASHTGSSTAPFLLNVQTFSKENLKLGMYFSPVPAPSRPLAGYIRLGKIQHFQQSVIVRENSLIFRHFPQLPIKGNTAQSPPVGYAQHLLTNFPSYHTETPCNTPVFLRRFYAI